MPKRLVMMLGLATFGVNHSTRRHNSARIG
jgi:hypothetical protein